MKRLTITLLLVSALGAVSAAGQALTLDTLNFNLAVVQTATIATASGQSGFLASVGCFVSNGPPVGNITAVMKITIGTTVTSYPIYTNFYTFDTRLSPFLVYLYPASGGWGQNVSDSFLIPINVAYPGNFTVEVDVTSAGTSGDLNCGALHS